MLSTSGSWSAVMADSGRVRGQSDDKSDDNDTSADEGSQGRPQAARRGSLHGPVTHIPTLDWGSPPGLPGCSAPGHQDTPGEDLLLDTPKPWLSLMKRGL